MILSGILLLGIFSACDLDDDGYSLSDFWIQIGNIEKTGEGNTDYIVNLDDSTLLYPLAFANPYFETEDNQRVLVNYTILDERNAASEEEAYYVKINAMREVLTKNIIELTEAIEDSVGNDPVHVRDAWIAKNYLNFELEYYGGYVIHYVNLGIDAADNPEGAEEVTLQFRHNGNDDPAEMLKYALVSFDLNSLDLEAGTVQTLRIKAKEYDNEEYEETFIYTVP